MTGKKKIANTKGRCEREIQHTSKDGADAMRTQVSPTYAKELIIPMYNSTIPNS